MPQHDDLDDNVLDWDLGWLDVRDKYVCPDCQIIREWKSRELEGWEDIGLPGSGHTVCRQRCRCLLIPDEVLELFPTLQGQGISLRDDKNLRISRHMNYVDYYTLDSKIRQYEKLTGDWNLPKSYYDLYDVKERIKFLDELLKGVKSGKIPDHMQTSLHQQNPWINDPNMSHADK